MTLSRQTPNTKSLETIRRTEFCTLIRSVDVHRSGTNEKKEDVNIIVSSLVRLVRNVFLVAKVPRRRERLRTVHNFLYIYADAVQYAIFKQNINPFESQSFFFLLQNLNFKESSLKYAKMCIYYNIIFEPNLI
jgi:hypothetical protein